MKAFVVTITEWKVSRKYGERAVASMIQHGLEAEIFDAVTPRTVYDVKKRFGVKPRERHQHTHMLDPKQRPYKRSNFMSHMCLWQKCIDLNQTIIVAEHDTVMTRGWDDPQFEGDILNLNVLRYQAGKVSDDAFAPAGIYKHPAFFNRGKIDLINGKNIEAGRINGTHFYAIKPSGARKLIEVSQRDGFINCDNIINEVYTDLEYISPVYGKIVGNLQSAGGWSTRNNCAILIVAKIRLRTLLRRSRAKLRAICTSS
jgi:GR25 family glycosyltransferase involved in LPS biosynthesis